MNYKWLKHTSILNTSILNISILNTGILNTGILNTSIININQAKFLFLISAICYSTAFIVPYKLGFFIILAYLLLFYSVSRFNVNLIYALLWSFIVNGVNVFPVWVGLNRLLENLQISLSLSFILIIYVSFYTVLWLIIISRIKNTFFKLIITFGYIFWLDSGFLWFFDEIEGYSVLYPLVPLMTYNTFINIVGNLGKHFTVILVLSFSMFLSMLLSVFFRKKYCNKLLLLLILFGCYIDRIVFLHKKSEHISNFDSMITCVAPSFKLDQKVFIWDRAHEIADLIEEVQKNKTNIKIICMPESTFPFNLNEYPEIIRYWRENALNNSELILGAHRSEDNKVYNTFYLISQDKIQYYDKQHRLFYAERLPYFIRIFNLAKFFILGLDDHYSIANSVSSNSYFDSKNTKSSILHSNTLGEFTPIICSELFFYKTCLKNNTRSSKLSIALVNDSWYSRTFLPDILYLSAILQATDNNINLIYVGYIYSNYI